MSFSSLLTLVGGLVGTALSADLTGYVLPKVSDALSCAAAAREPVVG